jgi:hypothetical protein
VWGVQETLKVRVAEGKGSMTEKEIDKVRPHVSHQLKLMAR